ncbi:histidinol phosphate aminotransferase [Melghiribacillus thermohalophilus]|uniref:Histidinol-phosphate aminotransferase n=1 Tax=Melghiribacillus thermohalophilus TaxID=1324956 RepID=A0A4R3N837_9BACI|nr:histidinol-phosphate transaminase [Melghiribacillus thermohalophilus]TCT25481.1 histidinol phosphate aminotransferase [Melghiribacillus thermohalophilus]
MSKYWSQLVKQTDPYVPGEQPSTSDVIKLNTNENPYPPSPEVTQAISRQLNDSLRLYPPPSVDDLRETIGDYYGVNKNQVFVGNGSDEVLAFSFMAFFDPGKPVMFPDITYSFYPVYARLFQLEARTVPLTDDFSIPVEPFFHAKGGVIFPNPNAPTGKYLNLEAIEQILIHNPDNVVIVDEAYIDFGGESAINLLDRYDQLLVIQTMSKSRSLAGLRVGYALGRNNLIEGLNRIKNSFNSYTIDRLAIAGARASFQDEAYFQKTRAKIIRTRNRVTDELKQLGFNVIDSQANFIFITHSGVNAGQLYQQLKANNIYVRYFDRPRINHYLRVSIGTDEEMDIFLNQLKNVL